MPIELDVMADTFNLLVVQSMKFDPSGLFWVAVTFELLASPCARMLTCMLSIKGKVLARTFAWRSHLEARCFLIHVLHHLEYPQSSDFIVLRYLSRSHTHRRVILVYFIRKSIAYCPLWDFRMLPSLLCASMLIKTLDYS